MHSCAHIILWPSSRRRHSLITASSRNSKHHPFSIGGNLHSTHAHTRTHWICFECEHMSMPNTSTSCRCKTLRTYVTTESATHSFPMLFAATSHGFDYSSLCDTRTQSAIANNNKRYQIFAVRTPSFRMHTKPLCTTYTICRHTRCAITASTPNYWFHFWRNFFPSSPCIQFLCWTESFWLCIGFHKFIYVFSFWKCSSK